MVALLDKKCRVCFIEQDLTANVHKYSEIINECLPITIEKNDGHGNKICHKCLFEITLCGELIALYKKFEGIPSEINKCYLCLKDNINLPVHGSLFRTIRKVESSLTIKKILKGNPIIGRAPWNVIKKRLRTRKVCTECYFMIDTVANLYEKIKATDEAIKKIVEETDNWMYGEDPIEADENNSFRIQNNPSTSSASNEQDDDDGEGRPRRRKVNGITVKEEPDDSDEDESFNSDELSELSEHRDSSDAENDADNHNLLKRIKEEVKEESDDDDEGESDDNKDYDMQVKKEIDQLEDDDSPEITKQKIKVIKEEPVDSEDQDEEENDRNFEESPPEKRKTPILKKTNRKIKQEVVSDNSEKELDDEPDVNDIQEAGDDEDEEEKKENYVKSKNLKKASVKSKQKKIKGLVDGKSSKNKVRFNKSTKVQNFSDESNSEGEDNISTGKEITSCSWCNKPFNDNHLKGNLCLTCIEKYQKAMDGIHAGRICRVFVSDLKYSNNNHKVKNGAFEKGKLENKIHENVSNFSNKENKSASSTSLMSNVPSLAFKKQTKPVVKQSDSKLVSGSGDSSKNALSKTDSREVSKKKATNSIVPFLVNNKEVTDKPHLSGREKRKRTTSVASSVSSEVSLSATNKFKDLVDMSSDLESDASSHISKKLKRNGDWIDNKLKLSHGWQVKLIKLSIPQSSQELISKDMTETSKLLGGKSRKPGPKSANNVASKKRQATNEDSADEKFVSDSAKIKKSTSNLLEAESKAHSSDDSEKESDSFTVKKTGPKSKTKNKVHLNNTNELSDDSKHEKNIDCSDRSKNSPLDVESRKHVSKLRKPGPKSRKNISSEKKQDISTASGDSGNEESLPGPTKMKKNTSNLKSKSKAGPKSRTQLIHNKAQVNTNESNDEDSEKLHNMESNDVDNEDTSDGKRIIDKLPTSPKSGGSVNNSNDSDIESELLLEVTPDHNDSNNITNEEEEALLSEKDNISSGENSSTREDEELKDKKILNLEKHKKYENGFLEKVNGSETAHVDSSNKNRNLNESLAEKESEQSIGDKDDLRRPGSCEGDLPKDENQGKDTSAGDLHEDESNKNDSIEDKGEEKDSNEGNLSPDEGEEKDSNEGNLSPDEGEEKNSNEGNLSPDEGEEKKYSNDECEKNGGVSDGEVENVEANVSENKNQDPEKMELSEQDNSEENVQAFKRIEM